jgi:cobalt/nickel transport system permease protein
VFQNRNFIERSIKGALAFLKESIFADDYAARNGLLQSLDPRIKTFTFLLFLIQILLIRNILILLGLYAFCLLLTLLSKINLGFFLKRTWIFIPLFSILIAIPALFNIVTPGEPLVIVNLVWLKLTITRQGLFGALLFIMRVVASVSFAVLLSVTTKHFDLLKVLRVFKIPQLFVMTLGMCYRYIYLFVETIENVYLAIKSRVGTKIHYKRGHHIVAWNIAYLWTRSYQLNEAVYQAMLSRGYQGEPVVMDDFEIRLKDGLWLGFVVMMAASVIYLDYRLKVS